MSSLGYPEKSRSTEKRDVRETKEKDIEGRTKLTSHFTEALADGYDRMVSEPGIGDAKDISGLSESSKSNLAVLDEFPADEDLEVVLVEGLEEVVLDFGEGREDGLSLKEERREEVSPTRLILLKMTKEENEPAAGSPSPRE